MRLPALTVCQNYFHPGSQLESVTRSVWSAAVSVWSVSGIDQSNASSVGWAEGSDSGSRIQFKEI